MTFAEAIHVLKANLALHAPENLDEACADWIATGTFEGTETVEQLRQEWAEYTTGL